MDKLMDNHWFLKGIALLLALMLFMVANLDKQSEQNSTSAGFPVGDTVETLSNVEVSAHYDQDNYIVSGLPDAVTLELEGQSSLIAATKLKGQFEVFANLNGYEEGTYDVRLQYNGIPEKIKVKIDPVKVKVTIEKKVKKSFPVEVGFINSDEIKAGYKPETPVVKPEVVEIAGTKEQLEQISVLKAFVDLKGASETLTKEVKVNIYDKNGNRIDMQSIPEIVTVTVPIVSPEKKVPITIKREGTLPEGITITDIKIEPKEITIFGPLDVLDAIEELEGVVVELDKITETTTFEATVPLPKGVIKASADKVKVIVEVEKQERKTLSDISLQILGLTDTFDVIFLEPENGRIDIDVLGEPSVITELTAAQIKASINVKSLPPGTHDIPVQINSPNNVTLESKQQNAKIELVRKS